MEVCFLLGSPELPHLKWILNLLTAFILEVLWKGGQFLNSPNGLKQPYVKSLDFPVANKVFHIIYVQLLKMEECSKLQNNGKEKTKEIAVPEEKGP